VLFLILNKSRRNNKKLVNLKQGFHCLYN